MSNSYFTCTPEWTQFIAARLCACDPVSIIPLLHDDVSLAGAADGVFYTGIHAVSSALFRNYTGPARRIVCWHCHTIVETELQSAVSAAFCATDVRSSQVGIQMSIIWQRSPGAPQAIHMHLSSLRLPSAPAYQAGASQRLAVRSTDGAVHMLDLDQIVFIEAVNMDSVLHLCKNRRLQIREQFCTLCGRLPPAFCRIHRSFVVNRQHVLKIRRYSVLLTDNNTLPIPEKRYRAVCAMLSAADSPTN